MRDRGCVIEAKPSRTALRVAMRRATHQVLDQPKVFDDPLAVKIAGAGEGDDGHRAAPFARALRAFLAARSRYAEDQLREGRRGAECGNMWCWAPASTLSLIAIRFTGLHVFEVDHPATQEWKRARLDGSRHPSSEWGDFCARRLRARSRWRQGLAAAGFDRGQPAFFSWLGVTPYLTRAAFDATVQIHRGTAPGSGVVFDYAIERRLLSMIQRMALDAMAARVARGGRAVPAFLRSGGARGRIWREWDSARSRTWTATRSTRAISRGERMGWPSEEAGICYALG